LRFFFGQRFTYGFLNPPFQNKAGHRGVHGRDRMGCAQSLSGSRRQPPSGQRGGGAVTTQQPLGADQHPFSQPQDSPSPQSLSLCPQFIKTCGLGGGGAAISLFKASSLFGCCSSPGFLMISLSKDLVTDPTALPTIPQPTAANGTPAQGSSLPSSSITNNRFVATCGAQSGP